MAAAADRLRTIGTRGLLTVAAYAALGSLLCWSRLAGLGRGYASDELMTVRNYVTAGPREILAGAYVPNNHELFSLLGWATTSLVGESEVVLRLWSAIPFILGVIVVTAWLHVRVGALSGVLFLFFATASPLLLDITRQARGYGLAFLAMAVLTVAALETQRSGSRWLVGVFCAAGIAGTWTLPHFGVAFLATGAVLLGDRTRRREVAGGLAVSMLVILAWYLPHLDGLFQSSRQEYGTPIEGAWVITAPIDQTLIPALRWLDEVLLDPDLASLALTLALGVVIGTSPLFRRMRTALVLGSGATATVVVLWIGGVNVAPRFFSFLLVPLLILLATGSASILARFATTGRPVARTALALIAIGLVAVESVGSLQHVTRLPREAVRDVAALVDTLAQPTTPVFAYVPYPRDLEHYLGRSVEAPRTPAEAQRVCDSPTDAVLVTQPWILPPASIPCTERAGARHYRFEQYGRGGEVNVWLVPPQR